MFGEPRGRATRNLAPAAIHEHQAILHRKLVPGIFKDVEILLLGNSDARLCFIRPAQNHTFSADPVEYA